MRRGLCVAGMVAAIAVTAASMHCIAAPILVQNAGFEAPALGNCEFNTFIDDWTLSSGGVWAPGMSGQCQFIGYPTGMPAGQGLQLGFTNGSPIAQALAAEVEPWTRYVLRVMVGHRADGFTNQTYRVQLYGGEMLLAEDNSSQPLVPGGFVPSTAMYDALPGSPALGEALRIELARVTGQQANFDNVSLDAYDIDCNDNGVHDEEDIARGLLEDANGNGVADGCDDDDVVVGDLNRSGTVNAADLAILLGAWSVPAGTPGCGGALPCPADLNGGGFVNAADLAILLGAWTG